MKKNSVNSLKHKSPLTIRLILAYKSTGQNRVPIYCVAVYLKRFTIIVVIVQSMAWSIVLHRWRPTVPFSFARDVITRRMVAIGIPVAVGIGMGGHAGHSLLATISPSPNPGHAITICHSYGGRERAEEEGDQTFWDCPCRVVVPPIYELGRVGSLGTGCIAKSDANFWKPIRFGWQSRVTGLPQRGIRSAQLQLCRPPLPSPHLQRYNH